MNPFSDMEVWRSETARRQFLSRSATGMGAAALATLLNSGPAGPPARLTPRHIRRSRVKRVIWLTQAGAPSQLDLFDPKPGLYRRSSATSCLPSIRGEPAPHRHDLRRENPMPVAPSVFPFQSPRPIRHAAQRDPAAHRRRWPIRSASSAHLHTEAINHDPAMTLLQTGHQNFRATLPSAPGCPTASAPRTPTSRPSSS